MFIQGKPVGDLCAEDVEQLLASGRPESVTLEYKRDLPTGNTEARKEFLADISAMANTQGGVILFGVDEERDADGPTGIPKSDPYGVAEANADKLTQQILQRIQGGLNPELTSVKVQALTVQGKMIVAIGVPRSLYAPHAVWIDKSGKFYRRNDKGKYQVATTELRQMFLETQSWAEATDAFRLARINKIQDIAVPKYNGTVLTFLHILPLGRLTESVQLFADNWQQLAINVRHWVGGGIDYRPNLDGFIVTNPRQNGTTDSHTQMFRCGGIEHLTTSFEFNERNIDCYCIDAATRWARDQIGKAIRIMKNRQLEPPFAVYFSVLGGDKLKILWPDIIPGSFEIEGHFSDAPLLLPALILDAEALSKPHPYKGLLDMLWQAAGRAESPT